MSHSYIMYGTFSQVEDKGMELQGKFWEQVITSEQFKYHSPQWETKIGQQQT